MQRVVLPRIGTQAAWRTAMRGLLAAGVPADRVLWSVGHGADDLFAETSAAPLPAGPPLHLPRAVIDGVEGALCHTDPQRFARAHDCLSRLISGQLVWDDRRDATLRILLSQARAVSRDVHKTHAFVRFREVHDAGPRRRFAAWFEPEFHSLERAAPFFARRFGDMDWLIATPDLTATFAAGALTFTETLDKNPPPEDATEELWRIYYANIFNPARLMTRAMKSEMPKKYWHNLPEASLIPDLIAGAQARVQAMAERAASDPPLRRAAVARAMAAPNPTLGPTGAMGGLRAQAAACTRCPLHGPATQVVFGTGPTDAALMIVGEQPGDHEDLRGEPFVGPAGQLLRRVATDVGLDLGRAYLTNAVKHFKFTPRGKRRLHQRADAAEVEACKWWLTQERALVRPRLTLILGATAARALTGSGDRLLARRGQVEMLADDTPGFLSLHPAYILRLPDPAAQQTARATFAADLRQVAGMLAQMGA